MMPKKLEELYDNSDFDLTVKDLYETEVLLQVDDLDQSSFLDSSLDTSLNTTFGSTF